MFKGNLWKLVLSGLIAVWAVWELIPLNDVPFVDYAPAHATARPAEFRKLLDEATALKRDGKVPSEFVGLRQIGDERQIDLSQYFPDIRLESTLSDISQRNEILLNELLLRSKAKLQRGLDLQGGVAVTLEADTRAAGQEPEFVRAQKLEKAKEIIASRIKSYAALAEPIIRVVGVNRIEVEVPGVNTKDDPDFVENMAKPAKLEFCKVDTLVSPETSPEPPPGYEKMSLQEDRGGKPITEEYYVKRIPEATGEILADARAVPDPYGRPEIYMQFTSAGGKRFGEITRDISEEGRQTGRPGLLAIVLDDKLCSAPVVHDEIDGGSASITGSFTDTEAYDLANDLNNPLDVAMRVTEQYEIGPSLAQDAISSGVRASIIGTAAVAGFMIVFYTTGGLVAVGTLAVNIVIILGVMASKGATMTLPGLAGIVLTIGMAVDANILIFERIREELAAGKPLSTSNQSGYRKALTTIIDAHIVQLIICTIMIGLGSGPIKDFGTTLAIGVLSTMFTVLITAHVLMENLIDLGWMKKLRMRHLLPHIHVDFIRYGRPAFIGSWMIVLIGFGVVLHKGATIYGIDFAGGDVVTLQFKERIDIGRIRAIADAQKIGQVEPTYESSLGGGSELLKIETPENKSGALVEALRQANPGADLTLVGQNHIGAAIGKEIELNALLAVGVSMLTILFYIAFRFEFGFGVGAMVSILHDILMTIGIFVITGHQFSAPMVAAILCIAGYSINETVVVFDRIREELKLNPNGSLRDVVNSAINKVFARTIMTATTTFLAALSLFLFGTGVLSDISFTFLVGIVTSTFSAIFIAAQVFYWWHKGDRKHVEAHSDVAPKYEWTGSSKASR